MKNKGLYTGSIAVIAIVIIVTVAFNSVSTVKANESRGNSGKIVELKWQWQNAYYLLGKSAADALADGSHGTGVGTCVVNAGLVQSYANAVLAESLANCSATNVLATINVNNVTIDATISCSKQLEGFSASYEKNITFDKQVWTFDDGLDCYADVLDNHSGICEVDTFGGGC